MENKKIITDELINERLEAKGFGDKQISDSDLAKESVLNHFHVELIDDWSEDADFYIYEESTVDGHSVFVATCDTKNISVNENIYYYDHDLSETLQEAIKFANGDEDYPEKIYVDDLYQDFVDDAIQELFAYLSERFEEEIITELEDEGYKYEDIESEVEFINKVNNILS